MFLILAYVDVVQRSLPKQFLKETIFASTSINQSCVRAVQEVDVKS